MKARYDNFEELKEAFEQKKVDVIEGFKTAYFFYTIEDFKKYTHEILRGLWNFRNVIEDIYLLTNDELRQLREIYRSAADERKRLISLVEKVLEEDVYEYTKDKLYDILRGEQ